MVPFLSSISYFLSLAQRLMTSVWGWQWLLCSLAPRHWHVGTIKVVWPPNQLPSQLRQPGVPRFPLTLSGGTRHFGDISSLACVLQISDGRLLPPPGRL